MDELELKKVLEVLLLSSTEPLSLDKLQSVFDETNQPTKALLQKVLADLSLEYTDSGIELKIRASGYCFQTKVQYQSWVMRLNTEKPVKYSNAFLETLAIIAYRQPVTRADIESIRGVAVSSSILKGLLEREWVRVAGFRDVPGKPAVYATTKGFLDYFGLASLDELPSLQHNVVESE